MQTQVHASLRDFERTYEVRDSNGVVAICTLHADADYEDLENYARGFIPGAADIRNLAEQFQQELVSCPNGS